MSYWLLKSEPTCFSIDQLDQLANKTTPWDGVRNYQARNYLKSMKKGDQAFFYHSSCDTPGIVGIVEVVREAYPEKDQLTDPPRWFCVDVKLIQKFSHIITLSQLRETFGLENMVVLRKGNRLSVMPVQVEEWKIASTLSHS